MEAWSTTNHTPNQNILLTEYWRITKIYLEMKGKLLGGFFVLLYIWFEKFYVIYFNQCLYIAVLVQ